MARRYNPHTAKWESFDPAAPNKEAPKKEAPAPAPKPEPVDVVVAEDPVVEEPPVDVVVAEDPVVEPQTFRPATKSGR